VVKACLKESHDLFATSEENHKNFSENFMLSYEL
jgi:hypothetical protein